MPQKRADAVNAASIVPSAHSEVAMARQWLPAKLAGDMLVMVERNVYIDLGPMPIIDRLTCWDPDRLDLGRVGITPNPRYLCTDAAKNEQNLQKAHTRAMAWRHEHHGPTSS